ncbi:hypothetical protein WMY93_024514 [Mugilogobius chulae]|uniref:Uncharacterized protein n=1 Tax=Mugilogobius chulae TaxID=88201 RepID=A0AAW0N476_9GOBI
MCKPGGCTHTAALSCRLTRFQSGACMDGLLLVVVEVVIAAIVVVVIVVVVAVVVVLAVVAVVVAAVGAVVVVVVVVVVAAAVVVEVAVAAVVSGPPERCLRVYSSTFPPAPRRVLTERFGKLQLSAFALIITAQSLIHHTHLAPGPLDTH